MGAAGGRRRSGLVWSGSPRKLLGEKATGGVRQIKNLSPVPEKREKKGQAKRRGNNNKNSIEEARSMKPRILNLLFLGHRGLDAAG